MRRKTRSWPLLAAAALLATVATAAGTAPAMAATPDRFGFALYYHGAVAEQWPAGTVIAAAPGIPGAYSVTFPGQAAPDGAVHVIGVYGEGDPAGVWCQAGGWLPAGPDEIVQVRCYRPGGAVEPNANFSVQFSSSSGTSPGGWYGYIHAAASGATITSYTTAGFGTALNRLSAGVYSYFFTGLSTPGPLGDGSIQVTAANPFAGARCTVSSWMSSPNGQFGRVGCVNPAGTPADTGFSLSYQFQRALYGSAFPPSRFGYLYDTPPLAGPTTNFNPSGAPNTAAGGPPMWQLDYPNLSASPGNVQVTAVTGSSDYCTLVGPWHPAGADLAANVRCYDNSGNPSPRPTGFTASYSSLF